MEDDGIKITFGKAMIPIALAAASGTVGHALGRDSTSPSAIQPHINAKQLEEAASLVRRLDQFERDLKELKREIGRNANNITGIGAQIVAVESLTTHLSELQKLAARLSDKLDMYIDMSERRRR